MNILSLFTHSKSFQIRPLFFPSAAQKMDILNNLYACFSSVQYI